MLMFQSRMYWNTFLPRLSRYMPRVSATFLTCLLKSICYTLEESTMRLRNLKASVMAAQVQIIGHNTQTRQPTKPL